nr:hypothetical protein [Lachnospiraceae bacterium]
YTFKDGKIKSVKNSDSSSNNIINIYYNGDLKNVYIHYTIGNSGEWTQLPGEKMDKKGGLFNLGGSYFISIDLGAETTLEACFNNNEGGWDSNNGGNYRFTQPGTYYVGNGKISQ